MNTIGELEINKPLRKGSARVAKNKYIIHQYSGGYCLISGIFSFSHTIPINSSMGFGK